jgi:hypothetical protein
MKRIVLILVAGLILSLLSASIAASQVQTRIRVIQASNEGSSIDPALIGIHDQLGSLFSFTSYRLLKDETLSVFPNRPVQIPTHRGREIEITLIGHRRHMGEFRLRLKREGTDILNTQVRLFPGRTVLIGGPKHGEGVIILALSASF